MTYWWHIDDILMIYWLYIDDILMIYWWYIDDIYIYWWYIYIYWSYIDDILMIYIYIDDILIIYIYIYIDYILMIYWWMYPSLMILMILDKFFHDTVTNIINVILLRADFNCLHVLRIWAPRKRLAKRGTSRPAVCAGTVRPAGAVPHGWPRTKWRFSWAEHREN